MAIKLKFYLSLCFLLHMIIKTEQETIQTTEIDTDGCATENENQAVIFENRSGITVELYLDDQEDGVLIGSLRHKSSISIATQPGQTFYYTPKKKRRKSEKPKHFMMYNITIRNYTEWVVLYKKELMKGRNDEFELQKSIFMKQYRNKTGIEWRNYYPRDPVIHHYHKVEQNGDIIVSETENTQLRICSEQEISADHNNLYVEQFNETFYCREKLTNGQKIQYEMVNICAHGPVVFQIMNFLSEDECDHLIRLGQDKGLRPYGLQRRFWDDPYVTDLLERQYSSQDVLMDDETWYDRDDSFIVDNIMRRIADMVNITEDRLYLNGSAEAINLFHYYGETVYNIHLDSVEDKPNTQYITVLLYLNDVEQGGQAEFTSPDERCADENGLLHIEPIKGSIIFMYNLLSDGNIDRKTEHHNMPPIGCEKWMANVWIWDKVFQE